MRAAEHISGLLEGYNHCLLFRNGRALEPREAISAKLEDVSNQVSNIVELLANPPPPLCWTSRLNWKRKRSSGNGTPATGEQGSEVNEDQLREIFKDAREKLKSGTCQTQKQ